MSIDSLDDTAFAPGRQNDFRFAAAEDLTRAVIVTPRDGDEFRGGEPVTVRDGTEPSCSSARGPAFRGRICDRVYDGLRNFQRHPSEETTGK